MKLKTFVILIAIVQFSILTPDVQADSQATDILSSQIRCSVCGMHIANHSKWLAQIHYDNLGDTRFFDGVKDMMVYYFNPEKFKDTPPGMIRDLFVKDFHSLAWLSAKESFYVVGSEVRGPMGDELIPFGSKDAAEAFLKKYNGKEIVTFEQITPELIESLRSAQKMH
jgi:nitrous oxide reductase accessory protein NosL